MILEIEGLTKRYVPPSGRQAAPITVLNGFSLTVAAGEFVAVQGPSGCGKSTLLLVAGGLLRPDGGSVRIAALDPYAMAPEARARFRAAHTGFVFQQFHLVPYLNVLDNVLCPALALETPNARRRADELIEHFGLSHRRDHVPARLSTGERQRTALARALLNNPKLLLADEPTGNLDEDNGAAVLGCLAEFTKAGGAVLLVTHDPRVATNASRVCRLET